MARAAPIADMLAAAVSRGDAARILGNIVEDLIVMLDRLQGDADLEDSEACDRVDACGRIIGPYAAVMDEDREHDDWELTDWAWTATCSSIDRQLAR